MHPETLNLLNKLTLLNLSSAAPETRKDATSSPPPLTSENLKSHDTSIKVMPPISVDESKDFSTAKQNYHERTTDMQAEQDCVCNYIHFDGSCAKGLCLNCLKQHNEIKRVRSTDLFSTSLLAKKFDRIMSRREFIATSRAALTSPWARSAESTAVGGKIPAYPVERFSTHRDVKSTIISI
ncbi:hypothetical protein DM02DRAFT_672267 [Periconia macrospinosa]|uniref:Uncharacterized protein n=1 Tax=Periconia macrospinosa TaxID=97972 RepID=A0A2V1DPW7_9PLEO|nr:hypothetical protein DM02DRAFT_672267 [Periconia macrospinosa]